jgi:hypothetical protein
MRGMSAFAIAFLIALFAAIPAHAGPVFFAVLSAGGGIGAAFGATALGTFVTSFTGRLLLTVAVSALQRATAAKPKVPGITTETTATGGTNPAGFLLGSYATAGDGVCPPMSHGEAGGTPNAYLTYVIALGDVAGQTLERVAIDGAFVDLGVTPHADYGLPVTGRYSGYAWVKFYDGNQTVADPMLLAKYGSYPERPWTSDMIGRGVPYVIVTFRYNRELFSAFPTVLFQCGGIKLYDPRLDTTAGGSGSHRWGVPSTYGVTHNNAVIAYNILRGITLPGLGVWGGNVSGEDLPVSNWFAAMNKCDVAIGTPPVAQFQAGYEVRVDSEPADVLEELLKGCTGEIAEIGGTFKMRVGGSGLPVYFMSDDDIVVSKEQDYEPFAPADQRQNGIDAQYPDPATVWATKAAPSRYNPTWEAEDGERRVTSLDLPACPYPDQVQRVMANYIADERRFRRHGLTMPPDAAILEPLDVVSWTSQRNGYAAKTFDLSQVTDDLGTLAQRLSLREVDATDYDWSPASLIPVSTPSAYPVVPAAQTLTSWTVQPLEVGDGAGTPRKPGIVMTWSTTALDAVEAVQYQVRVKVTGVVVKVGTVSDVAGGRIPLTEGIVQGVIYQARAIPVAPGRATAWTDWLDATAPALGISPADLTAALAATITNTVAVASAAQAELNQLTSGLVTEVDGALAAIEARTRAGLRGWLTDPIFSRWTSGNLTAANWFSRSGVTSYGAKVAGLFGSAIGVNVPTGTGVVQFIARNDAGMNAANPDAPYLVLSLIVELIAGDTANSALRLEWSADGSSWTRGDMLGQSAPFGTFQQLGIDLKPGILQTVETLVKRPAGAFSYVRLVANAKTISVTTAHSSVWHLVQVRVATQADIDTGQVYTVAGTTGGSTQTVTGIGAAMAAANSGLTAQVGGVRSDLATNYSTTATMTGAIAAASSTLSASIDSVDASLKGFQAQKLHADFRFGDHYWAAGYAYSVSGLAAAPYPSVGYGEITLPSVAGIGPVLEFGATTFSRNISERVLRPFITGQKIRLRMKTRLTVNPSTGSHITRFYFAIMDASGDHLGLATVATFTGMQVVDGWKVKEAVFEPSTLKGAYAATAASWRIFIQGRSLDGAVQQVEYVEAEDVTFEQSADSLFADITDIKAVDVSALSGTALGTLLTQLSVGAGGSSAWVTSQTSAVAKLTGDAAASYSLRVGAGGASAGFEIVASNDPIAGPASAIKLSAKHLDIVASSVRISDSSNIYPDFDMVDPLFYSTANGATYAFIGSGASAIGRQFLSINSDAAAKSVESGWFAVEPNEEYLINGLAWLPVSSAGQGTATLSIETGAVDAAGLVSVLSSDVVSTKTDLTYSGVLSSISLVTGPTARRARFKLTRAAGGSGAGRAGGFKVQKKAGASLLVDGLFAVTGMGIFGGQLKSSNYVAGLSGWSIKANGDAEFANLVARGWLTAGAVSDKVQDINLAAVGSSAGTYTQSTIISTGSTQGGQGWHIFVAAEVYGSSAVEIEVIVQRRRFIGGAWEAWYQSGSKILPDPNNTWQLFGHDDRLCGTYDDVQFRVCATQLAGAPQASALRNCYLTAQRIMK